MNGEIKVDFADMEKRLKLYVDKGWVTGFAEAGKEPITMTKPDASLIKPLKKINEFHGRFSAVDCSTRTLKRANNWGIYLMRATYASGSVQLSETHMYVGAFCKTFELSWRATLL
jgi:hypothetical protein